MQSLKAGLYVSRLLKIGNRAYVEVTLLKFTGTSGKLVAKEFMQ